MDIKKCSLGEPWISLEALSKPVWFEKQWSGLFGRPVIVGVGGENPQTDQKIHHG